MLVVLLKATPYGLPHPADIFATLDEKPNKNQDGVEITLTMRQGMELANWLNERLFGIQIRPKQNPPPE